MKTLGIICFALVLGLTEMGCSGGAYVTEQPADVVYERPVSPGVDYVWVDGDWYYSGGRYVHRNGYWTRPRQGRTWVSGHWNRTSRGYNWQRGHWARH